MYQKGRAKVCELKRPSTDTMRCHLNSSKAGHPGWDHQDDSKTQTTLPFAPVPTLAGFHLSVDQIKQFKALLVDFVITRHESLSIVDCPEFRYILVFLNPRIEKHLFCRNTLKTLILDQYKECKANLSSFINSFDGFIALTTDMCSSTAGHPYHSFCGS
ncbi:hypothetical protein GEMRC1_010656 [Eukaryota sp. GEM-RC1]